jgi:hypothetical protein
MPMHQELHHRFLELSQKFDDLININITYKNADVRLERYQIELTNYSKAAPALNRKLKDLKLQTRPLFVVCIAEHLRRVMRMWDQIAEVRDRIQEWQEEMAKEAERKAAEEEEESDDDEGDDDLEAMVEWYRQLKCTSPLRP